MAAGGGSRLKPLTLGTSKHLLPVFDKPMIYYALSVLMIAEIRYIVIVSPPDRLDDYQKLLGTGSRFGIEIKYVVQSKAAGVAEGLVLAADQIGEDHVCLILGDNFFYGQGFKNYLLNAKKVEDGATIFTYQVGKPSQFGIAEFEADGRVSRIVEKPEFTRSNHAVTGLYFYDNKSVDYARSLRKSARGELEITDINSIYLTQSCMNSVKLGRGFTWLDTGNPSNLLEAGQFVETIQNRQGFKIACLEEIGYRNGWISHS